VVRARKRNPGGERAGRCSGNSAQPQQRASRRNWGSGACSRACGPHRGASRDGVGRGLGGRGSEQYNGVMVAPHTAGGTSMLLLLILVIILLFAAVPAWPYSRGWGYYPSGGLGLIVLILVILLLMGRI